jgi:hypothetical protein
LVKLAPPSPSSADADKGTLLHNSIAEILDTDTDPVSLIGTNYEGQILDQEMISRHRATPLEMVPAKSGSGGSLRIVARLPDAAD